jgi:hypothetical protein
MRVVYQLESMAMPGLSYSFRKPAQSLGTSVLVQWEAPRRTCRSNHGPMYRSRGGPHAQGRNRTVISKGEDPFQKRADIKRLRVGVTLDEAFSQGAVEDWTLENVQPKRERVA